ncbi:MAG: metallophosphoesterase [Bacteroidales bacterium]|nr:metallophosphoesterase [Bacteroidales bacterium]
MKRFILIISILLAGLSAGAQETPRRAYAICGPYVQNPTTTGFTVVWESNMHAIGWVELAPDDGTHFYNSDRPKYYDMRGFGNQVISTIHKVRVDGLQPGTTYRYRIMMKGVKEFKGPGEVEYVLGWGSNVYSKNPFKVTTLKKDYDKVRFDVYNDIHQQDSILNVLMQGSKKEELDFVAFNGDMVSSLAWKEKIRDMYLATGAKNLEGSIPLYNLRGNHEFRGVDTKHWFDYADLPEGKPYWTASYGKFFFIFLDTCEDKPDNDIEYGGTMLSEPYLKEEAAWLSKVVESDECKNADVRIVIGHIYPESASWYGNRKIEEHFVPVLNKAGISLWIAAHLHQWREDEPGKVSGANFPVIVNSTCERLEVTATKKDISLKAFSPDGKQTHSYNCKVK